MNGKTILIIFLILIIAGGIIFIIVKQYKNIDQEPPVVKEKIFLKARSIQLNYIDANYIILDNESNQIQQGSLKKESWEELELPIPLNQYTLCAYSNDYYYNCQKCENYQCVATLQRVGVFNISLVRVQPTKLNLRIKNSLPDSKLQQVDFCLGWSENYIRFFPPYSESRIPTVLDQTNLYYKCYSTGLDIPKILDIPIEHENLSLTDQDFVRIIVMDKDRREDSTVAYYSGNDISAKNAVLETFI